MFIVVISSWLFEKKKKMPNVIEYEKSIEFDGDACIDIE